MTGWRKRLAIADSKGAGVEARLTALTAAARELCDSLSGPPTVIHAKREAVRELLKREPPCAS